MGGIVLKNNKRIDIITCPHCGAEYTAGEIYIPECFLGVPKNIDKDCVNHTILTDLGKPMDTRESYICDYCKTPFKVSAYVKFNVEEDTTHNFNKNYVTSVKKGSLFLSED